MFLLKTTSLFLLACLYQNSLADAVLPMWAMCGGSAFVGTDTCSAELTCVYVNKFYSSCQQISQTQGITLQPVWAQCGGANWAGSTVCEPHLTCVYMSKWYSQCQQLATPPPETAVPTHAPTSAPVVVTSSPTKAPVVVTSSPTKAPVVATSSPTKVPVVATSSPTKVPVVATSSPTQSPVVIATSAPTPEYTGPTVRPWGQCGGLKYTGNTHCEPGWVCTYDNPWYSQCLPPRPTTAPTPFPAGVTTPPTSAPSNSPSRLPTSAPTRIPTNAPSVAATFAPSRHPSPAPSVNPTGAPTPQPTLAVAPSTTSTTPTLSPSPPPTTQPTQAPTRAPTTEPSGSPTRVPTAAPTDSPSGSPSLSPTLIPSPQPTRRPTVVPTADTYTGPTVGEWGQCAGLTYTGSTVCAEGLTCVFTNAWYSQCQRVRATLSPSISPTVVPVPTKAPVVPVPTQAPIPVPTFPPTISPTAAPSVVPTTKPSVSPTPVPPPTDSPTWATLIGYSYGDNTFGTIASYTEDTLLACQDKCAAGPGCDFYTYQSSNRRCNVKFTDKAAYMSMEFKGQQSGYLFGYLRGGGIANVGTQTVASAAACRALCDANSNCQYVSYDTTTPGAVKCYQMRLKSAGGITLGFREQVRPPNYSPSTLGRFDVIGNAGIVAIAANLMPDGRILLGARPEYDRGGPNYDNISPNPTRAQQVPYGEIAAIFDPITATSVPSQIDDNIFCHGVVLAEDGRIFTAGGDGGGDMNRAAAVGLTNGLRKIRYFDPDTDEWTILDVKLQATRWYPTLIRVPSGSIWVMGGLVDGATNFNTQNSLELYTPGLPNTKLLHSPLLQMTGGGSYNYMTLIPQTGNIFAFAARHFAIIDKDTGQEVEDYNNGAGLVNGIRSGNYPSAGCTMPLKEDATGFVKAEWIMFGGVNNEWEEITVTEVARMVLTDPYGQKRWTYDSDPIPYGRIMSDCVLYPNGNILLFNGGRRGRTGGSIGEPLVQAAANDVFSYDPEAPAGQKFSVLAATPFQRFYHSNTVLVPDGRVLVMGTDEGTYVKDKTAYNHDVEAFTPPWLLDNTPRPVITAAPNTVIQFGSTFTVTCSGNVDKLTIMTPQSSTHGTEMTQRLYIPTIVGRQGNMITLRAPRDATVMMSGYHMLFAVNGKTPSVAQWIRLG